MEANSQSCHKDCRGSESPTQALSQFSLSIKVSKYLFFIEQKGKKITKQALGAVSWFHELCAMLT